MFGLKASVNGREGCGSGACQKPVPAVSPLPSRQRHPRPGSASRGLSSCPGCTVVWGRTGIAFSGLSPLRWTGFVCWFSSCPLSQGSR